MATFLTDLKCLLSFEGFVFNFLKGKCRERDDYMTVNREREKAARGAEEWRDGYRPLH